MKNVGFPMISWRTEVYQYVQICLVLEAKFRDVPEPDWILSTQTFNIIISSSFSHTCMGRMICYEPPPDISVL